MLVRSAINKLLDDYPTLFGAVIAQLLKLVCDILPAASGAYPTVKSYVKRLFICHCERILQPGARRSHVKSYK
jgi:hypothetical protein